MKERQLYTLAMGGLGGFAIYSLVSGFISYLFNDYKGVMEMHASSLGVIYAGFAFVFLLALKRRVTINFSRRVALLVLILITLFALGFNFVGYSEGGEVNYKIAFLSFLVGALGLVTFYNGLNLEHPGCV
jgi:membrane associated rhomboid family serine protease